MEEDKYTYVGNLKSISEKDAANYFDSITSSAITWTDDNNTIDCSLEKILHELNHGESLKDVELPEDKTSVDLAKLTSEVIIKFLRSPEGISLLANELDKYFKK